MVTYKQFKQETKKKVIIFKQAVDEFLKDYPLLTLNYIFDDNAETINAILVSQDFPDFEPITLISLSPKRKNGSLKIFVKLRLKHKKPSFKRSVKKNLEYLNILSQLIKSSYISIKFTKEFNETLTTLKQNLPQPISEEIILEVFPNLKIKPEFLGIIMNLAEKYRRAPWKFSFLLSEQDVTIYIWKDEQLKRANIKNNKFNKSQAKIERALEKLFKPKIQWVDDDELMKDPNYSFKDIPQKKIKAIDTNTYEVDLFDDDSSESENSDSNSDELTTEFMLTSIVEIKLQERIKNFFN